MNEGALAAALRGLIGMNARDFVRHRDPMLLVSRLVDIGADFAICEWNAGDSVFLDSVSGVPAYTGIETMAQCIAVHAGAHARIRGLDPPIGLLLGTRRFRSSVAFFEPGRGYSARCDALFRDARGMSSFACELTDESRVLATARLTVLEQLPNPI